MLNILNQYRASSTICIVLVSDTYLSSLDLRSLQFARGANLPLSHISCRCMYHSMTVPMIKVLVSLSSIKTCTKLVINRFWLVYANHLNFGQCIQPATCIYIDNSTSSLVSLPVTRSEIKASLNKIDTHLRLNITRTTSVSTIKAK